MMNFDFIKDVEFSNGYKENLVANALSAEKYAKYDPFISIINARPALECLLKGILKDNGYTKIGTLHEMIEKCVEKYFVSVDHKNNAREIKNAANNIAHANPTETMHKATEAHIKIAIDIVKSLFIVCAAYFGYDGQFDEEILPFNEYYIKRKVRKSEGEIICGDYNYFVHEQDGDEYFLQCYPLGADSNALVSRSEESRKKLDDFLLRKTYLLQIKNIELYEGSDRRLVVYSVPKNSLLLCELNKKLSCKKALCVGLDLINSLLEMKMAGVHHRNINPGCIILSPYGDDDYLASLVNMQTTKIVKSDGTIIYQLADKQKVNHFIPADIRTMSADDLIPTDWEKVDVYSVAKAVIYCINPDMVDDDTSVVLAELEALGLSDDYVDFFEGILDNDTANNPDLYAMKDFFENELRNL